LAFERREILLIVGVLLILIGTMAVLSHYRHHAIIAATIAVSVYFGIRTFVKWRKKQIRKAIGEGVCASCGTKILEDKCPNCDTAKEV
jgi:Na+/H+ antiporter NhaC